MIDQAWHQRTADQVPAPTASGRLRLAPARRRAGVDFAPVPPRYRSTYFSHTRRRLLGRLLLVLWSEVLDASVEWLQTHGGLTRRNGDHFGARCCRAAAARTR